MNELERLTETQRWKLLLGAAVDAVESAGYSLTRLPGRGRYSVFAAEKSGKKLRLCVRTTRDRFIAFPPINDGKAWKTLDDVDQVAVATVDSKINPRNIEIFVFSAAEVRKRFNKAYRARRDGGVFVEDKFGFWVGLDRDESGGIYSPGTGLVDDLPANLIAVYPIKALAAAIEPLFADVSDRSMPRDAPVAGSLQTIGGVIDWARRRVAGIAGVDIDAVRLDMKVEY